MMSPGADGPYGNGLLDALPEGELEILRPHLEVVALGQKDTLIERYAPIESVYFPTGCVASLVAEIEDGQIVEVGKEGMVGLPVFLGVKTVPLGCFCQVPGDAIKLGSDVLRAEVRPGSKLHELLQRYTEVTFVFAAQSSACNRLHSVEQRASRWLLQTHDRVGRDEFGLTQEFLSQMLGVRRASVSEVAAELQEAGCISYSCGAIKLLDRASLEAKSCECYRVIAGELERLLY